MKKFLRSLASLELEEQILNIGALVALVGVFFPWTGGEWLGGETVAYSGFGFYTSYIGITVFCLQAYILTITFSPLLGGPHVVKSSRREYVRLLCAAQSTILSLAALSVLTKTTLDFARMELRFGVYVSIIGGLVTSLYAFLRYQEQRKRDVQELFHYPTESMRSKEEDASTAQVHHPIFTPPPPPKEVPEEHKTFALPPR